MASPKPTIILIHGLWMSSLCWEDWIKHYRSRGYNVLAPGWPGIDGRTVDEIRAHPTPAANKGIEEAVAYYENIISQQPVPPILIGHSFGAQFVQILLSRGYGAAGIALEPVQPAGIFKLPFSMIRSTFPILWNPLNYRSTVNASASHFHYTFGNHLSAEESHALWEKYSIPAVAKVMWQGALGLFSKSKTSPAYVDLGKARAPLLLLAGSNDHVIPASVVEKQHNAYNAAKSPSVVQYKVLEGRTHGVINQKGWEEVADFALDFAGE